MSILKIINHNLLVLGSLVVLSACSVGPSYVKPKSPIPCQWKTPLPNAEPKNCQNWWTLFEDDLLNHFVSCIYSNNYDIKIALSKIRESRYFRSQGISDFFPHINSYFTLRRDFLTNNQFNLYSNPDITQVFAQFNIIPNISGRFLSLFEPGFDASWEIDIFGRNRRNVQTLTADLCASIANKDWVVLSMTAEVVLAYAEIRKQQRIKEVIILQAESWMNSKELMEERFDAGLADWSEVEILEAEYENALAKMYFTQATIEVNIHRLAILLGCYPTQQLQDMILDTPNTMTSPKTIPIGIPSEILCGRPDIRKAEREVAAANYRVGVALGDMFPKLNLLAGSGWKGSELNPLFIGINEWWFVEPTLRMPIFNFGKLWDQVGIQNEEHVQAIYNYQQTVIKAMEETENALSRYVNDLERNLHLEKSLESSVSSKEITQELYLSGVKDFLSVLDRERTTFRYSLDYEESNFAIIEDLIRLFKAIGGNYSCWENE